MGQPIMNFDEVGTQRSGSHRGGLQQKYILDERGRRLLMSMYDGSSENITKLEHLLRVPRKIVKKWASELGLARQKAPAWTAEEIQYLQTYIRRKNLTAIAKHLGRTKAAVKLKARRLHLSFVHTEGYSMVDVSLALGNDKKTILKWIEKGWLKGKRQGPNTMVWSFTNKDVREFIITHPNEVDPRHADWLWLVDLLAGGNDYGIGTLATEYAKSEEAV